MSTPDQNQTTPVDPTDPTDPSAPTTPPNPDAYPALFDELLSKVPLTLTPEERTFLQSRLSDEKAKRDGASVESVDVLRDLEESARTALPHALANTLPGYGPLRLRYALELGHQLATNVATFDAALVKAIGSTATTNTRVRDTGTLRRRALRALKNLSSLRPDDVARVRKAGQRSALQADDRARSLELIAKELETLIDAVPSRIATDAGATPDLMNELRDRAKAVLTARSDAQDAHGSIDTRYATMNILDGRILRELRLLAAAMRDGNAEDPKIPIIRPRVLTRRKPKTKTPPPAKTPTTQRT